MWEIRAQYFGESTGILDWYHASEHVRDTAKKIARDSSDGWADTALHQMREGGGKALLAWLRDQHLTSMSSQINLAELINYVATKIHIMNYPSPHSRNWQIGTGMIKSTCKQLVGLRLKGPVMHWSELGALAVTALRAIDLNGKWNSFLKNRALVI